MKYHVVLFTRGRPTWQGNVSANTPKDAVTEASIAALTSFTHARIEDDKNVYRYTRKFQKVRGDIRIYKVYAGYKPAVMLMVGTMPEIYRYENAETRNKIYEELCTDYTSAASAKASKAQKDTTASTGATKGSKSGLTCQKIWNGSVTPVTWMEKLTQFSIDKSFGNVSVKVSAKPEWYAGSKASHSKQTPTFLATVKNTLLQHAEISFGMLDLVGVTIEVVKTGALYYGAGWYWHRDWLDFRSVYAYIKHIPAGMQKDGLVFTPSQTKLHGTMKKLQPCEGSDPVHYTCDDGYCFAKDWLQPATKLMYEGNAAVSKAVQQKTALDEIATTVKKTKLYVESPTKAFKKAVRRAKKKQFKADWMKYAALPLAADDEPISTAVDPATIKPPLTVEEFKKVTRKIKKSESKLAEMPMMESPWMDMDKALQEIYEEEQKKFKFLYGYGVYKKPKLPPGGIS